MNAILLHLDKDSPVETVVVGARGYLDLNPNADVRRRHDCALVMANGTIHLDYDSQGWLVGMELVEEDPRKNTTGPAEYLQPKNPLKQ